MFISKYIQVCLEALIPRYRPIAQHFKNFLANTMEMDKNTGFLFQSVES